MREKVRRWYRYQWQINIATGIFSAIAIGLAFAEQYFLAQLAMIPVIICFIASCAVAYYRYQYNKKRREEIIAQANAETSGQLRELFDKARRQKNLPPDAQSRDGYTATLKDIQAKASEETARQLKEGLPPGVKRRGGGDNSGKR